MIPEIRTDPLGCLRSTADYPAFLAAYLHVRSYADVSCSAARTRNLREPQVTLAGTNPPQLDALTPGTDLVTLGIGGNDFKLFGEMIRTCARVRVRDPAGTPCRNAFTVDGVDTKLRDAGRIEGHIAAAVREIRDRAPHATVVVVGNLRILPPHGSCPSTVPFAEGDYTWANRVERRLNESLRTAARTQDATYVDMYPASRGHDACAGTAAWVNGDRPAPLRALSYHPFRAGMRAVAREVYRRLTGRTAPPLPPRRTDAPTMSRSQQEGFARLLGGRND